ncbi:hypothetical protein ABZP36_015871 [Zizania latifolia]
MGAVAVAAEGEPSNRWGIQGSRGRSDEALTVAAGAARGGREGRGAMRATLRWAVGWGWGSGKRWNSSPKPRMDWIVSASANEMKASPLLNASPILKFSLRE